MHQCGDWKWAIACGPQASVRRGLLVAVLPTGREFQCCSSSGSSRAVSSQGTDRRVGIAYFCALSICPYEKGLLAFLGDWLIFLIRASC